LASGKGTEVGEIKDVQFGSGEAPTLIVKAGEKEFLIPYTEQFLRRLEIQQKRLEMELPEGLLELDAPHSAGRTKAERKA
jgi:16S rRNA processing protein RimM